MKTMKEPHGKQNGFTLIELMIALVVITLVIIGFLGANITAQRNTEEMNQRTIAIQDANRAIERMRSASRTGTFPSNVTSTFLQGGTIAGFTNLNGEQVTVAYANATTNPLDVTITVTWSSYAGRQGTETVRTYITQR